jgi:hypothetical protein
MPWDSEYFPRAKAIGKLCKSPTTAMPAKAGIQCGAEHIGLFKPWIPAFAGMTDFCRPSLDIANALLADGHDEGSAIRIAIARAKSWGVQHGWLLEDEI